MQRLKKRDSSDTYLIPIAGIIILALCSVIFFPLTKIQIIGVQGVRVTPYDDRQEKSQPGNSNILSVQNESAFLKFSYILNKGFSYPYAGVTIHLEDTSNNFFDCTRFDVFKIRIASSQLSDCKLYLKVFDAKFSKINDPLSERYLQKDLILSSVPVTFSIPFKQFTTPEWWYQKNNITLKDVTPVDLSKVTTLQIESGSTAKTGIIDTITISQIYLTKSPNKYAICLLIILLASGIAYTIFRLVPRGKSNPIIITYDKKEISSYRDIDAQRISSYLAENFSEPELSILTMGKSIGLSQKKAVKVINEVFKMSFKQYLTSIRIHEAKRLLLETDRLVIDIALAVGFSSISHFNRVFKAYTQISPLEFRNKKSVDVNKTIVR
jgi:AraC-like DNA-binding protein